MNKVLINEHYDNEYKVYYYSKFEEMDNNDSIRHLEVSKLLWILYVALQRIIGHRPG